MTSDPTGEPDAGDKETVPATSYVTLTQYQHWQDEAEERNQSVSTFISAMVEVGVNQISIEQNSPDDVSELRHQLQSLRSEKEELRRELQATQQQDYHIGLGRIKDLIINNPGIDRREISNYVSENVQQFVNKYLDRLEDSEFENKEGGWYPPEGTGDDR